jgi:hypothetical protein
MNRIAPAGRAQIHAPAFRRTHIEGCAHIYFKLHQEHC